MDDDWKREAHSSVPEAKCAMNRREFIHWTSLLAGWIALEERASAVTWAGPSSKNHAGSQDVTLTPSLLEDGSLEAGRRGWEFGEGCRIVSEAMAPTQKVLHVLHRGTSTARAVILSPIPNKTYTLHGYMKTKDVTPLEPGGAAVMSINQFEFQGRPVGLHNFAVLEGSHDWTPFSYTFTCQPLVLWLELSLGLFRAEGEAWFAGVTLVEGPSAKEIAEVVPREEAPGYPAPKRKTLSHVAILRDKIPAQGTLSDPEAIGAVLRDAGYEVEYLTADQLGNPAYFTRERFDILVLAYGASFPAPAQKTLETFLSRGGSFFSTGGYAFNCPLLKTTGGWAPEMDVFSADPGTELIRGGNFDATMEDCQTSGWKLRNAQFCSVDRNQTHQGKPSAMVAVPQGNWWDGAAWEYEVAGMQDRDRFVFSCWARVEQVADRFDGTAFIYLEHLDEQHASIYVCKKQVVELRGSTDWQRFERVTVATPQTKFIRVTFGLNRASGKLWVSEVSLRKKFPEIRMNTAKGFPNDELRVTPEQIGVFDADYRLRRVSYVSTAPDQDVVKIPFRSSVAATGYAASGVLGTQDARWTPLLNCYDGYGRLRGAAGALMRHYNGFYRKSHWAFFGVENHDLLPAGDPAARSMLLDIFDALHRKTFLHEVQTDYASYRRGENPRIFTRVSNFGYEKRSLTVSAEILALPERKQAFQHAQEVEVQPDTTVRIEFEWDAARFAAKRYEVRVALEEGSRKLDHAETGFLVWDESVLRNGFPLKFRDNYLRANERTVFLQGCDDYIYTLIDRFENPRTWYQDISKYRDHFLLVYENLLGGRGLDDVPPEAWWRKLDALFQICQECKVVFFPGLLIFGDTAVENADLKHQQEFCHAFARRYGLSSGMMYYLNGDLRLRNPNLPDLRQIFNEYLKKKYGDEKRLREIWAVSPPSVPLGSIPPLGGSESWRDMRTADNFWFRVEVVRRWLDAMAGAIREVDQAHPITAEFYQLPVDGIDVVMSVGTLTLGNIGYFDVPKDDIYRFPQNFRFVDMRARGKSINDGEFGVKTHPAWEDAGGYLVTRSEEEENQYYLAIPHYVVGLGGSKVHNWCWKYPADLPFEWGINYPCDRVSRDPLLYYRNTGLFFRQFDLQYQTPELFFLIADNHRVCGRGEFVHLAQQNAIRFLLNLRCNFGTIDELHLDQLPASCKVLVYPMPFCPDDATFTRIMAFVEQGGILYVSGDISYDQFRQRNRLDRLSKLLGVKFIEERYPNIEFVYHPAQVLTSGKLLGLKDYEGYPCIRVKAEGAEVLAWTSDETPVIVTHRVGRGRVFYTTDIPELHAPARTTDLGQMIYASFLTWAGVKPAPVTPESKWIHFFREQTRQGDELYILVNRDESAPVQQIRFQTSLGPVRVDVAQKMTGAVAVTAKGALQSLETSGRVEGPSGLYCEANAHLMLFSLDSKDILHSGALCLLPMGEGHLRLNSQVLQGGQFEVGEFQEGKWVPLERGQLQFRDGAAVFDVTQDRNLSIVLLSRAGEMSQAVGLLSKLHQLAE